MIYCCHNLIRYITDVSFVWQITCIPWLEPPKTREQANLQRKQGIRLSLSDAQKRTCLLHEFVYYIFDSILIPLVRANFYVTESQIHRNRLFYFRHDMWRRLTEKPLEDLQSSMFQPLKHEKAQRLLARRSFGHGSLRLLPKTTGTRPILNLRRRAMQPACWSGRNGGAAILGPSINSIVTPISNVLNYESARNPMALGSALRSVGEISPRLKSFKERLQQQQQQQPPKENGRSGQEQPGALYFVKLDIQSCFDTIPQEQLLSLIERTVSENSYLVSKHVEFGPPIGSNTSWSGGKPGPAKPTRKFVARATSVSRPQSLTDTITTAGGKGNRVFVDTLNQREHTTNKLLDLLDEHVRNNLAKVGKKYVRQRNGIPQGSVLSSLLCNLFYGELERKVLGFTQSDQALLLRLIDDFLLITSDPEIAMQFLQTMMKGQPEYGVTVNPSKSLVNFEANINGITVPRLIDNTLFPYCGYLIDTHTLEIHKDQDRLLEGGDSAAMTLSDALTVESTRIPGRSFNQKMLKTFQLQLQSIYLDTSHNSTLVALSNLYGSFVTCAMKMYRYMKSLRGRAHPRPPVITRTIRDLINMTYGLIRTKQQQAVVGNKGGPRFECSVQQPQVQYLAATAFRFILGRKQTRYGTVLRWLDAVWKLGKPRSDADMVVLQQVIRRGNSIFGEWRF